MDRLTYAHIDLRAIDHNLTVIKQHLSSPSTRICAVVKANAYGHGDGIVAKHIEKNVHYFAVSCLYEAKSLRESGIRKPILILGYTEPDDIDTLFKYKITPTVIDKTFLYKIQDKSRKKGIKWPIHIKVDTGMNRLGIKYENALEFLRELSNLKNISFEGIFTHFSSADEKDKTITYIQLKLFNNVIKELHHYSIYPPIIHAANSAAVFAFPGSHFSMVRPGLALYGISPLSYKAQSVDKLKPALSLRSKIVQVKEVTKGHGIGYGREFIAPKKMIIGTLPIGYADGLRRKPYHSHYVLINGSKAPIIGRISMDMTTIDLTEINVNGVTDVTIIGTDKNLTISAGLVAKWTRTIPYEVISSISKRVTRIYKS